jgi:hypothetical protein
LHDNFEVKGINGNLLSERRELALHRLIFTYRDIILKHRIENEKRAKPFKRALFSIVSTIIGTIVYVSI